MITISAFNSTLSPVSDGQLPTVVPSRGNSSNQSLRTAALSSDTAGLSNTAQATVLFQQGMTVSMIAYTLDLTAGEVNSYLGITTSSSLAAVAPSGITDANAPGENSLTLKAAAGG